MGTTLEMLKWKATNGVTDKGFGELVQNLKNMLPEGNELPSTTYESRKIVCILYCGVECEKLEACPVCGALRYKIRQDDPGEVEGQTARKRIPAKVMWYFPIGP